MFWEKLVPGSNGLRVSSEKPNSVVVVLNNQLNDGIVFR